MEPESLLEIALFLIVLVALAPGLGAFIGVVLEDPSRLPVCFQPFRAVERGLLSVLGKDARANMTAAIYAGAVVVFGVVCTILLTGLLMLQGVLPLNPQSLPGVSFWLALNTAVSFVSNTNWQAYSGETSLSYLSQMVGLTTQNFVSAAVGIAVMAALARGIAGSESDSLGNFWVDVTRSTLYVLLPLAVIWAFLLVSQGVVQTLSAYVTAHPIAGGDQVIPLGPAASQIAIKQLGTNGGGFFGVNSAHPFENPTPLSNFLQVLAILLIPAALPFTFGRLVGNRRHGIALFGAMLILFLAALLPALYSELQPNPSLDGSAFLEGKETRLGIVPSVLWGVATTAASNGSVNAMHSSFSPLSGGIVLLNMLLGEVVFGGVGSGVYGIVLFAILTVFIAGLMVGRTPEYLGKKIESGEVKLSVVGVLLPSVLILTLTALALSTEAGLSSLLHKGPHGLSEAFYAFTSGVANNGSAFAGLSANTPFYNGWLALAMFVGRYGVIVPVILLAGALGRKKTIPPSPGTFPSYGWTFTLLLCAIILFVGALTFFPALSLGPVMEHLLMLQGRSL